MELEALPPQLRPIVQPIDTWFRNLRLGLLFEARVAGGKLMVCSMDLGTDLDQRPVARQMRYSLLRYMVSDEFSSTVTVDPARYRLCGSSVECGDRLPLRLRGQCRCDSGADKAAQVSYDFLAKMRVARR